MARSLHLLEPENASDFVRRKRRAHCWRHGWPRLATPPPARGAPTVSPTQPTVPACPAPPRSAAPWPGTPSASPAIHSQHFNRCARCAFKPRVGVGAMVGASERKRGGHRKLPRVETRRGRRGRRGSHRFLASARGCRGAHRALRGPRCLTGRRHSLPTPVPPCLAVYIYCRHCC